MEYIQGGYGDDYDYWTDEIGNFMSGYLEDYASGMAEGQIWWDWKDDYGKYFQPYNTRKENILQEITDEKITGLTDEFGEVNKAIASNIGREGTLGGESNWVSEYQKGMGTIEKGFERGREDLWSSYGQSYIDMFDTLMWEDAWGAYEPNLDG